jgi:hypothetical protein
VTIPAFPLVALTDAETTAGKPMPGTFNIAMRDGLENIRERVYDPDLHTAAVAHDHDGGNSGHVAWGSHNMLAAACWNDELITNIKEWITSDGLKFGSLLTTDAGCQFRNENEYLYSYLAAGDNSDDDDLASNIVFGAGGEMTLSVYARAPGTAPTRGRLAFGLSDNTTNSFIEGCGGYIEACELSTSWKRFFFRCNPGDVSDSLWFLCGVTSQFDEGIRADFPAVTLGRQLCYWEPMPNEDYLRGTRYVSRTVPIWEKATSITNAIELRPV